MKLQRYARKRVDDFFKEFSKPGMPPPTRRIQSAAALAPCLQSAVDQSSPTTNDDARRLQVASDLLPSSNSILARKVKKPPKKRSEPVPAGVPTTRIRVKSSMVAAGVYEPSTCGESKATPIKGKKASDSRRCFVSRAFHREERLCISMKLPDEIIKERRRAAHKAAGLEWDRLHKTGK